VCVGLVLHAPCLYFWYALPSVWQRTDRDGLRTYCGCIEACFQARNAFLTGEAMSQMMEMEMMHIGGFTMRVERF
jgi:hypothetical protein